MASSSKGFDSLRPLQYLTVAGTPDSCFPIRIGAAISTRSSAVMSMPSANDHFPVITAGTLTRHLSLAVRSAEVSGAAR